MTVDIPEKDELQAAMGRKGISTNKELAARAKCSERTVNNVLARKRVKRTTLTAIMETLGLLNLRNFA